MSTKEEIAEAVADPEWQKFRLSLKGIATEEKLRKLAEYLKGPCYPASDFRLVLIRVDNYLKALARGGQIGVSIDYIAALQDGKLWVKR